MKRGYRFKVASAKRVKIGDDSKHGIQKFSAPAKCSKL